VPKPAEKRTNPITPPPITKADGLSDCSNGYLGRKRVPPARTREILIDDHAHLTHETKNAIPIATITVTVLRRHDILTTHQITDQHRKIIVEGLPNPPIVPPGDIRIIARDNPPNEAREPRIPILNHNKGLGRIGKRPLQRRQHLSKRHSRKRRQKDQTPHERQTNHPETIIVPEHARVRLKKLNPRRTLLRRNLLKQSKHLRLKQRLPQRFRHPS